jgi:hypothetical protein
VGATNSRLIRAIGIGVRGERRRRTMAIGLRVFFDESGKDGKSTHFVIAGVLTDLDSWHRFYDDWEGALKAEPAISYFKMNEAVALRKQFDRQEGWTEERANEKVAALTKVLCDHAQAHFVDWLDKDGYEKVLESLEVPKDWRHPYLGSFFHSLCAIEEYKRERPDADRIMLVYDAPDRDLDVKAHAILSAFQTIPPFRDAIQSITFQDDKLEPALQAADLVVWHYRNFHRDEDYGKAERPAIAALGRLRIIGSRWHFDQMQPWSLMLHSLASGRKL